LRAAYSDGAWERVKKAESVPRRKSTARKNRSFGDSPDVFHQSGRRGKALALMRALKGELQLKIRNAAINPPKDRSASITPLIQQPIARFSRKAFMKITSRTIQPAHAKEQQVQQRKRYDENHRS
jgi:hypothetical protein